MSDDRLTGYVAARLRGEAGPDGSRPPQTPDERLRALAAEALRPWGWVSAAELRGTPPRGAQSLAADVDEDEPRPATAEELEAWEQLDEATQALVVEGDPDALAAWRAAVAGLVG